MTVILIFMAIIAVALLAASFHVIRRFDPARTVDHIARSLVQMAIAFVSVFVALAVFQFTLKEREKESRRQHRQIVTSFIRSKILEVEDNYKSSRKRRLISAPFLSCSLSGLFCNVRPAIKPSEEVYMRDSVLYPADLDYGLAVNRAEFWQLMRAAPLVHKDYFKLLIEIMDRLDNESQPLRLDIRTLSDGKTSLSDNSSPVQERAEYFGRLALLQAEQLNAIVKAVCQMDDLIKDIEINHLEAKYDLQKISCPPYSDSYASFFESLARSSERKF